jgi:hypothetical protein
MMKEQAAAVESEAQKPEDGSDKVFEQIKSQLVETGMTEAEASANAQIFADRARTRAERRGLGESAFDLFSQRELKIQTGDPSQVAGESAAQSFNQDRSFQTKIPYPPTIGVLDVTGEIPTVAEAKSRFSEIQKIPVVNGHTGWTVSFDSRGKKKAAQTLASTGNRLAYVNINHLIERAILGRTESNRRGEDSNIKAVHIFYAPFRASGRDYVVSMKVRETNMGERFYDSFALEKETAEKLIPNQIGGVAADEALASEITIDEFVNDVKALQLSDPFFQGEPGEAARGRIRFDASRKAIIDLFQHKDFSTTLHEGGHLWLEELIEDATTHGVPEQLRNDLDTVLAWMGVEVRSKDGADAIRAAIKTEHHEKWARGIETYVMESKAPSQSLRELFAKFRVWLVGIYKNIKNLNAPLEDDVRRASADF